MPYEQEQAATNRPHHRHSAPTLATRYELTVQQPRAARLAGCDRWTCPAPAGGISSPGHQCHGDGSTADGTRGGVDADVRERVTSETRQQVWLCGWWFLGLLSLCRVALRGGWAEEERKVTAYRLPLSAGSQQIQLAHCRTMSCSGYVFLCPSLSRLVPVFSACMPEEPRSRRMHLISYARFVCLDATTSAP